MWRSSGRREQVCHVPIAGQPPCALSLAVLASHLTLSCDVVAAIPGGAFCRMPFNSTSRLLVLASACAATGDVGFAVGRSFVPTPPLARANPACTVIRGVTAADQAQPHWAWHAMAAAGIRIGDALLTVHGRDVAARGREEVERVLAAAPRRFTLRLARFCGDAHVPEVDSGAVGRGEVQIGAGGASSGNPGTVSITPSSGAAGALGASGGGGGGNTGSGVRIGGSGAHHTGHTVSAGVQIGGSGRAHRAHRAPARGGAGGHGGGLHIGGSGGGNNSGGKMYGRIFQTGIHVAKARPPPCDAGLSFSDHKGFRDRYPVVWAVAAGGAADIAGLEVGDLVTKVKLFARDRSNGLVRLCCASHPRVPPLSSLTRVRERWAIARCSGCPWMR